MGSEMCIRDRHIFLDGGVIFIAGLIDRCIYIGLTQYREQFFYGLWRFIIPSSIYTAIIAIILIILYRIRGILRPRII